jgi:autotransporter-associated beta strand protein
MNTLPTHTIRTIAAGIIVFGLSLSPGVAATNTWTGAGVPAGTETLWTAGTGYSGGTFTNNIADDLDFSGITSTGTGLTLSALAGTYNVKNLNFGTTSSTITSTEILNFNGNGTAGQTILNLAGNITLASPNASVVTMGSDLTLSLSNAAHAINFEKNSNVIGTNAVVPVLVINSKVTGGGGASTIAWGALKTSYGATGSSAQNLVLTNNTSDFDAQINGIRGQLSYTSIANSGVASSLGAGVTGSNATIIFSNGAMFNYVGSGDQATNRILSLNGSSNINNYATSPSVLSFNGAFGSNVSAGNGGGTFRFGVSTGNTIAYNSQITDTTSSAVGTISTGVTKSGLLSYYTASGAYDTTGGNGNGILELNAANTYTGLTVISAGTVKLGNAGGLGNGGAAIGPKLNGSSINTSGNGGTSVSTGATLDLNGQTGVTELISINGTGVGGNGALVNNSNKTASISNGVSSLTVGTVTGLSAVPTVTIAGGNGTGATATAQLGLSKESFGTVTVTGTYTTAPTVTISGGGGTGATATVSTTGVITITNPGVGYTSAPTIVFSGGVGTGGQSMSATGNAGNFILQTLQVTNAGSGYTSAPTVTVSSGTETVATVANISSVVLAGNSSIGGTGDLLINGTVSGGFTLTKVGAGTVTLAGANTYTGATMVSSGTLNFANTSAKAAGTVTAAAGATIGLGVGGSGYYSSANVDSLFANTLTGFTMNAASGVGIDTTAGDFTYATGQTGSRSLTKLGANTLTLSGLNSYTGGTRVNEGTLAFANSFTMSGANQVRIAGTGTAGANYATVSSTVGTLTFGGTLGINVTASLVGGESFNLFTANGGALAGDFGSVSLTGSYIASLTNNGSGIWTGTASGLDFTFSTSGVNAGILSVAVSSVPEPSTYAALFGTLILGVAVMQRRRSKKSV